MSNLGFILELHWNRKRIRHRSPNNLKNTARQDPNKIVKGSPTRGLNHQWLDSFEAWEGGRGESKLFPKEFKADYVTLNHLSPLVGFRDHSLDCTTIHFPHSLMSIVLPSLQFFIAFPKHIQHDGGCFLRPLSTLKPR